MVAAQTIEGHGVMMDLPHIARHLRSHAWVDDAQCGFAGASVPGALLAFNRAGVEALCSYGRQGVVNGLHTHLDNAGYRGEPLTFRLFDEMPTLVSSSQIDGLLQSPLPRDVEPVEEHEHGGIWTLSLRVPLDLIYFPGHFPQAPVLPGAVQIAWALSFASMRLGTPLRCHTMEALKFQQLMRPGDHADLTLRHDWVRHKLHFAYRDGDKAYSSGRLAWSAET
jgi:3-hydroxymyristoyl/3-hydroxydecanoyl-(acyl carrier protein) dehydratase